MKITGALLLAAASLLFGIIKAKNLSYRVYIIEFFLSFFRELRNEVSFFTNSVNDFLLSFSGSVFTEKYKENIEKGMDFPKAFKEAVLSLDINSEEKELLISFAENFGSFGRENSVSDIDYYIEKLKLIYEKAREEKREKTKLILSLSASVGAMFLIFVL